jgi:UDP-N-acetylglucosamine--N-acetylmuramyl-(pentapeptide) pyrophosphoryl-undecaprenol N-acetylglucosamine transferase
VPVVLHEANARPGLSNRLLGRLATRIGVAWPEAAAAFADPERVSHTGMPIRPELAALAAATHEPPPVGRLRLLVSGGSLGSPFLNRHAPALAAALGSRAVSVEVWHQAGARPLAEVRAGYAAAGIAARVDAHVDDMAAAYRWADAAVACAGAATLAELAVAGLPSLLVPYAAASDDHQADNAAAFAAATGARWMRESEWNAERSADCLAALARDPQSWRAQSQGVRTLARPDAADALVALCAALG